MIQQLAELLDARQGELQALATDLQGLATELRTALEAGGTTSDSIRETIAALDALMIRFEPRPPRPDGTRARPFDVTEYTEALRQASDTAQQLKTLIGLADSQAPALTQLSDRAADQLSSVVDHIFWRLVQLALVLVGASLLGALAYRAIARRS